MPFKSVDTLRLVRVKPLEPSPSPSPETSPGREPRRDEEDEEAIGLAITAVGAGGGNRNLRRLLDSPPPSCSPLSTSPEPHVLPPPPVRGGKPCLLRISSSSSGLTTILAKLVGENPLILGSRNLLSLSARRSSLSTLSASRVGSRLSHATSSSERTLTTRTYLPLWRIVSCL